MDNHLKDHWIFLGLALIHGLMLYFNQYNILFWDTIQFAGKHTAYFHDHGLLNGILLPDAIDSGHPPTFALYLVLVWKLLGKSLIVSHWAMFPFLVGILYQSFKIGQYVLNKWHWLFPLLLFLCPFYMGQSILVSPDIILVFGFLLTLRGLLSHDNKWIIIGSLILSIVSLRGIALIFCLFLYNLYTDRNFTYRSLIRLGFKKVILYLPAVGVALLFLGYHYFMKGWISHHPNSPWVNSYALVSMSGLIKNVLLMGHRMLDFGMVFIYAVLLWKVRYLALLKGRLIWLWMFTLVVTAVLVLPYAGLLNHRYFLPLQIIAILMASQVLLAVNKKYVILLVGLGLFSGNFWIYPDEVSQGWDSTYAHQSYYKEVELFQIFASENGIESSMICTAFPLKGEQRFLTLDDSHEGVYGDIHKQDCKYTLYSNIMNDFTDSDLEALKSKEVIYSSATRGVTLILYQ